MIPLNDGLFSKSTFIRLQSFREKLWGKVNAYKWLYLWVREKKSYIYIYITHNCLIMSHIGVNKKNKNFFYWVGMNTDIWIFCKSCDFCTETYSETSTTGGCPSLMYPHWCPSFCRVAIDIMRPIKPTSLSGSLYILSLCILCDCS